MLLQPPLTIAIGPRLTVRNGVRKYVHLSKHHRDKTRFKTATIARLPPACRMKLSSLLLPPPDNPHIGVLMLALKRCLVLLVITCSSLVLAQESIAQEKQEGRLMRFPDIYKDKVAFMYGGDLWLASTSG